MDGNRGTLRGLGTIHSYIQQQVKSKENPAKTFLQAPQTA